MQKQFNTAGVCLPSKHYMADVSGKVMQVYQMVENGAYFVINRPRQYGKTSTLYALSDLLQKNPEYLTFNISFEALGDKVFEEEPAFSTGFVRLIARYAKVYAPDLLDWLKERAEQVTSFPLLSESISEWCERAGKKVVLLIDEVDKTSNNQLFINFLGLLRNKYLEREIFPTFHSVVLAGVHDVRSLKLKMRPDSEQRYNSPWNIAEEFTIDMTLQVDEIVPMLEEYAKDKGLYLDAPSIASRIFYFSSGYPFLVSKLCKVFDEKILPSKTEKNWSLDDLDQAVARTVKENNTNFESPIKNLENNPDLYQLVYKKLVDLEYYPFSIHDPSVSLGLMYGILKNGQGLSIHNRIYEEIMYDYMASKAKMQVMMGAYNVPQNFILPGNKLDMEAVLLKFQTFMHEQGSLKDEAFLERNGRLIFLAFIKPIINGSGYDFKEPHISEERRLDVVITYLQYKYIVELKIWYGPSAHQQGLLQLSDYLNRQLMQEGYLLIFDHSKKKSQSSEWLEVNGKKIFVVRV
jgi:hypothetical protein